MDLVARKDGKRIAIEIETSKSDALANIRKRIEAGFDSVLSAATSARAKDVIARQVQALGNHSRAIQVLHARDLFERASSLF